MLKRTILIVDDSSLVRRQIIAALKAEEYQFVEAADGPSALAVLDINDIALVITDFTMPKMNGVELLVAIRQRVSRADVPVIVVSTVGKVDVVQRGWDLGVKAWLKKPFKPQMLASAVLSVLAP